MQTPAFTSGAVWNYPSSRARTQSRVNWKDNWPAAITCVHIPAQSWGLQNKKADWKTVNSLRLDSAAHLSSCLWREQDSFWGQGCCWCACISTSSTVDYIKQCTPSLQEAPSCSKTWAKAQGGPCHFLLLVSGQSRALEQHSLVRQKALQPWQTQQLSYVLAQPLDVQKNLLYLSARWRQYNGVGGFLCQW